MKRKKVSLLIIIISFIVVITLASFKGDLSALAIDEYGKTLGPLSLLPTIIAILLAFISHNVLISLLIGFLSGALIIAITTAGSFVNIPLVFVNETFSSIKSVLFDIDDLEILVLCFIVGGMVEVVRRSGGFEALAVKLTEKIKTPRKACLMTSILGCIIFFDDYANALIVGPIMRPITDRVKVSREKLSYIVDSTAAPVTGIAIISSWVAVELLAISNGLESVGSNASAFNLFLRSVPFCFYCLFCLSFIFLISVTERDFGPMFKAEQRARKGEPVSEESKAIAVRKIDKVEDKYKRRIFVAVSSIVLLVGLSIVSFIFNGRYSAIQKGLLLPTSEYSFSNIIVAVGAANTIRLVSISSLISSVYAICLGSILKLFNIKEAIKAWLQGAKDLFPTILMLIAAWSLAYSINNLGTSYYAVEFISAKVSPLFVPIIIFSVCCLISCASGSYGCLFVVMPLAIPLAFKMIALYPELNEDIYLLLCIGSVMAGSIFGDHCSPVTDCTILSAVGSGCTTMEHCKTQLPYAIICAIISILCGICLTYIGVNVFISLAIGILAQFLLIMIIGKKPI